MHESDTEKLRFYLYSTIGVACILCSGRLLSCGEDWREGGGGGELELPVRIRFATFKYIFAIEYLLGIIHHSIIVSHIKTYLK